jgi:hypothetical protein
MPYHPVDIKDVGDITGKEIKDNSSDNLNKYCIAEQEVDINDNR